MSVPLWRACAATTAALALIGLTSGCSSETASAAPGHQDAFSQCLTDNGVPAPPDGGPGGEPPAGPPPGGAPLQGGAPPAPPNVDRAVWDSAVQACQSLAPAPPAR